jgi:hypothetical protein
VDEARSCEPQRLTPSTRQPRPGASTHRANTATSKKRDERRRLEPSGQGPSLVRPIVLTRRTSRSSLHSGDRRSRRSLRPCPGGRPGRSRRAGRRARRSHAGPILECRDALGAGRPVSRDASHRSLVGGLGGEHRRGRLGDLRRLGPRGRPLAAVREQEQDRSDHRTHERPGDPLLAHRIARRSTAERRQPCGPRDS